MLTGYSAVFSQLTEFHAPRSDSLGSRKRVKLVVAAHANNHEGHSMTQIVHLDRLTRVTSRRHRMCSLVDRLL